MIYVRISEDGNSVYVYKPLFDKQMSKEKFEEKAIKMDVAEFLDRFPRYISDSFKQSINRVKEINDMDLTFMGRYRTSDMGSGSVTEHYFIGGRVFLEDIGRYPKYHQKEEGLKYGEEFYGKEFMEKHKCAITAQGIHYYKGDVSISGMEYESLKKEQSRLTKIVCLKKKENIRKR